jgi:hypothetical protein
MSATQTATSQIPSHVSLSHPNQKLMAGYISETDLAAELGVGIRTLRRWNDAHTGPLRTKVGRLNFYSRAAVTAWLLAQTEKPCRRSRRS